MVDGAGGEGNGRCQSETIHFQLADELSSGDLTRSMVTEG